MPSTKSTSTDPAVCALSRGNHLVVAFTDECYRETVTALLLRRDDIDARLGQRFAHLSEEGNERRLTALSETRATIERALASIRRFL